MLIKSMLLIKIIRLIPLVILDSINQEDKIDFMILHYLLKNNLFKAILF